MISLVVTIIGPDTPGLVDSLAAAVSDHEGHWLESRLSRLAGYFAGVVHVEVPEEKASSLEAALVACESKGLSITVHHGREHEEGARQVWVELVGSDRPGIVREVSRALFTSGANLVKLETDRKGAPMSGELLFEARALLEVSSDEALRSVRETLEAIATDLMVEIRVGD